MELKYWPNKLEDRNGKAEVKTSISKVLALFESNV